MANHGGSDHDVRLAAVGGQNGERAFKHAGHAAHSLEAGLGLPSSAIILSTILRASLAATSVSVAEANSVAFGLQVETQLRGVFDDAVMDDGHRRMLVCGWAFTVARLAIGGPARVADAHRGKRHRLSSMSSTRFFKRPASWHDHLIDAGRGQRHTGRVIASVFQTFQALRQTSKACRMPFQYFPHIQRFHTMAHQPSGRLSPKRIQPAAFAGLEHAPS